MIRAAALIACAAVVACSTTHIEPGPGELMLAIGTDLAVPKDLDEVTLEIAAEGAPPVRAAYPLPTSFTLPATLGILAGRATAEGQVTVRVTGSKAGMVRTLREVVTSIPRDRVALLRIPLEWACRATASDGAGGPVLPCPGGLTCIAGACVAPALDVGTLPTYREADVFSGGACFDVTRCFEDATELDVDLVTCSFPVPSGGDPRRTNVAVRTGTGEGICDDSAPFCLIPLDADLPGAWRDPTSYARGGRLPLPPGICRALERAGGAGAKVVVSTGCVAKTSSLPTCGPWSSSHEPRPRLPPPAPVGAGTVACTAELQCASREGEVCCWEGGGATPSTTCTSATACRGQANACDGAEDCGGIGEARVCCQNVHAGASCQERCDRHVEGERCSLTRGNCPPGTACKTCLTTVTAASGVLAVSICVAGDRCPLD